MTYSQDQGEPPCHEKSKIIVRSRGRSHCHRHARPIILAGPLKWSITKKATKFCCNLLWPYKISMSSRTSHLVTSIFTARCYASAVLAMALCLSVRLSVRLSVTSRSSTKTAKRRITQTTPHDTPKTLAFWSQRCPRNSTGVTPYEGAKCRWGGSKSSTFDK